MSWQIKWIAASLWPAPVIFTFPLKSRPCPQMSPISVWHKDCCKDAVQFCYCKAITLFGWNGKLCLHVFSKPLSQLQWQPVQYRMCFAILVGDPRWRICIITNQKHMAGQQHSLVSFGLQQMNI